MFKSNPGGKIACERIDAYFYQYNFNCNLTAAEMMVKFVRA